MKKFAWITAFIASIVIANWMTTVFGLVPIGFGLLVTAGTFAAGFALVARDGVQISLGPYWTLAAIVSGAILSAITSNPAIAIASGIAFLVSEMVDFAVFTPLRKRTISGAVLLSSIISAPVDTVLFLYLAGFGITWQAVAGQFIVKTVIAGIAALYLARQK
jgi:uncharacterized PurR-regulated membrane protein YhhQ (DUF165 family)